MEWLSTATKDHFARLRHLFGDEDAKDLARTYHDELMRAALRGSNPLESTEKPGYTARNDAEGVITRLDGIADVLSQINASIAARDDDSGERADSLEHECQRLYTEIAARDGIIENLAEALRRHRSAEDIHKIMLKPRDPERKGAWRG